MKTVNRTDPFIGFLLVSKIHSDFQSNSLSLRLSAGRDCAVMSRMRVQATRRSATVPVCAVVVIYYLVPRRIVPQIIRPRSTSHRTGPFKIFKNKQFVVQQRWSKANAFPSSFLSTSLYDVIFIERSRHDAADDGHTRAVQLLFLRLLFYPVFMRIYLNDILCVCFVL